MNVQTEGIFMLRDNDLKLIGYAGFKGINKDRSGNWVTDLRMISHHSKSEEIDDIRISASVYDACLITELCKHSELLISSNIVLQLEVEYRDFKYDPSNICKIDPHIIFTGILISLNDVFVDNYSEVSRNFYSALNI
jgi:hypothetical protein